MDKIIPLSSLFPNIFNANDNRLTPCDKLHIEIELNKTIYIYNNKNKIIKMNLHQIENNYYRYISDDMCYSSDDFTMQLVLKYGSDKYDETEAKFKNVLHQLNIKGYNYKDIRLKRINNEINRINLFINKIKNINLKNINNKEKHYMNILCKITNDLDKQKSNGNTYLLDDLYKTSDDLFKELYNQLYDKFKKYNIIFTLKIKRPLSDQSKLKIYQMPCLYKILLNCELYINYLNVCINNITKNYFYLYTKIFNFNDIDVSRIIEIIPTKYNEEYFIKDYYVNAVHIEKDKSFNGNGYTLMLHNNKWNIYPACNNTLIKNEIDIKNIIKYITDCQHYIDKS